MKIDSNEAVDPKTWYPVVAWVPIGLLYVILRKIKFSSFCRNFYTLEPKSAQTHNKKFFLQKTFFSKCCGVKHISGRAKVLRGVLEPYEVYCVTKKFWSEISAERKNWL